MHADYGPQLTHGSVWSLVCLVCSFGPVSSFATTPVSNTPPVETPTFLQLALSNSGTREVFDAFHTRAPARELATVTRPFLDEGAAIYPDEFRTIDGSGNAPGDLGTAGTVDLRNVTVGYGDGMGTPAG